MVPINRGTTDDLVFYAGQRADRSRSPPHHQPGRVRVGGRLLRRIRKHGNLYESAKAGPADTDPPAEADSRWVGSVRTGYVRPASTAFQGSSSYPPEKSCPALGLRAPPGRSAPRRDVRAVRPLPASGF